MVGRPALDLDDVTDLPHVAPRNAGFGAAAESAEQPADRRAHPPRPCTRPDQQSGHDQWRPWRACQLDVVDPAALAALPVDDLAIEHGQREVKVRALVGHPEPMLVSTSNGTAASASRQMIRKYSQPSVRLNGPSACSPMNARSPATSKTGR